MRRVGARIIFFRAFHVWLSLVLPFFVAFFVKIGIVLSASFVRMLGCISRFVYILLVE